MSNDELRGWFDALSDAYETDYGRPITAAYAADDFIGQVDFIVKCMQGAEVLDGKEGVIAPGCDGMYVEWVAQYDQSGVDGLEVQVLFDEHPLPMYLSRFLDDRSLTTNREATGNDGAWCVVEAIYEAFYIVKHKAFAARGLPS